MYVAAGDVTGDGLAEVITGTNRDGGPVRVFQIGAGVIELTSFHPLFEAFRGPVRVAAVDLNRIVPAVQPGFLSRLTLSDSQPRTIAFTADMQVLGAPYAAHHLTSLREEPLHPQQRRGIGLRRRARGQQRGDHRNRQHHRGRRRPSTSGSVRDVS